MASKGNRHPPRQSTGSPHRPTPTASTNVDTTVCHGSTTSTTPTTSTTSTSRPHLPANHINNRKYRIDNNQYHIDYQYYNKYHNYKSPYNGSKMHATFANQQRQIF